MKEVLKRKVRLREVLVNNKPKNNNKPINKFKSMGCHYTNCLEDRRYMDKV